MSRPLPGFLHPVEVAIARDATTRAEMKVRSVEGLNAGYTLLEFSKKAVVHHDNHHDRALTWHDLTDADFQFFVSTHAGQQAFNVLVAMPKEVRAKFEHHFPALAVNCGMSSLARFKSSLKSEGWAVAVKGMNLTPGFVMSEIHRHRKRPTIQEWVDQTGTGA